MQIQPTADVLAYWITSYVPEKDLFFLTEEQYQSKINKLDALVMPIDEFFSHNTYSQIDYANSYEYWNIKHAKYVIVAESDWLEQQTEEDRVFILSAQVHCERGMTLPVSFIEHLEHIPADYIQEKHVVLQRAMWERMGIFTKEQLLTTMVYEWWDKGDCLNIPESLPTYLRPFANRFGIQQGANCLAAVLYAVTGGNQPGLIHEWIFQDTFLEKLKQCHYQMVESNPPTKQDVIVWQDEQGIIQHAAYCIDENMFFNKHGQTIFNPWKLLSMEQLEKEWGHLKKITYRCLPE